MSAETAIRAAIEAASPTDAEIAIQPATFSMQRPTVVQIIAEVTVDDPDSFDYAALLQSTHGRPEGGDIVGTADDEKFKLTLTVNPRAQSSAI